MPPAKYVGIGKYTGELNDRYRPEIEQMQRILANNEIASVPGRNVGSVLSYSFDRNGTRYQGQLQYRSSDEINGKLLFLYELAQDLLDHGTPEINLHPTFAARSEAGNLVVDVVFGNDGTQEVVIDGPEKWLPRRALLNGQYFLTSAQRRWRALPDRTGREVPECRFPRLCVGDFGQTGAVGESRIRRAARCVDVRSGRIAATDPRGHLPDVWRSECQHPVALGNERQSIHTDGQTVRRRFDRTVMRNPMLRLQELNVPPPANPEPTHHADPI